MTEDTRAAARWHERTFERSLKNARQRAISRGDKFIKAAAALLRSTGKSDFTVQEVVDQAGMSLRSFYHHFATKDDLLLALIEETVGRYVDDLQPKLDATPGALAKLDLLVRSTYRERGKDDRLARGLVTFYWHLAESRTDEFVSTLAPQVELIRAILEEGVAEGVFRSDLPIEEQSTLVLYTLLTLVDMRVLGVRVADAAITDDHLVEWCFAALRVEPEAGNRAAPRR